MADRVVNQHDLYPLDWSKIARAVKTRAGWKCEACRVPINKYPFNLEAHHIDGNPQNNDRDNLVALCALDHKKVEGMIPRARSRLEVIQRLRTSGRQLYFK